MRRFRRFSEATPAPEKKSPYKEKKHKLMNPKEVDSIVRPITSSVSDRYRRKGGGPALIDNEYTPMTVMKQKSVTLKTLKPCKPAARSGKIDPLTGVRSEERNRECQVELTFLDRRAAAAVSKHNGGKEVAPGPYMRVCLRPRQPGRLIPIRDPIEAKKFSEDWCRCTKREGDGEKCLRVNQTLERAPFGRSGRKATRRR
jgi:hypothetical protein